MEMLKSSLHLALFSTLLLCLFGLSNAENKPVWLKDSSRSLSYDGVWHGFYDGELRGTIKGNILTWGNGVDSGLTYESGDIHLGPFVGQISSEDYMIYWNDADIWINYDFQAPTTSPPAPCVDVWPARRCERGQDKASVEREELQKTAKRHVGCVVCPVQLQLHQQLWLQLQLQFLLEILRNLERYYG